MLYQDPFNPMPSSPEEDTALYRDGRRSRQSNWAIGVLAIMALLLLFILAA